MNKKTIQEWADEKDVMVLSCVRSSKEVTEEEFNNHAVTLSNKYYKK